LEVFSMKPNRIFALLLTLNLSPLTFISKRRNTMKTKFFITAVAILMVCLFSFSSAQVPHMINYQGKLLTSGGALVNDTVPMTFSIYADTGGGFAQWTETQAQVTIKDGIFNVFLGSVVPIPDSVFDGDFKFFGVKVGADPEMAPRTCMVSVPYAFTSSKGGCCWDCTTPGYTYIADPNEKVGIGTSTPRHPLTIAGEWIGLGPDATGWDIAGTSYGFAIKDRDANSYRLWIRKDNGYVGIGATAVNRLDVEGGLAVGTNYSGTYTAPTDGMIIEGNVGIGTTVPAAKLHIGDPFSPGPPPSNIGVLAKIAGPTAPALGSNTKWGVVGYAENGGVLGSGNMYGIYGVTNGTDDLSIGVYGSNPNGGESWAGSFGGRVYMAGNVGIGTTSPQAKLHINGTTFFGDVAKIGTGQRIQSEYDGGMRILGEQGNTPAKPAIGFFSTNGIDDGGGGNGIFRPLANTMAFATVSQERMRISSVGNVGIGTTDPQRPLHISDVMRLEPRAAAPANPSEGDIYVNSSSHHIYCYLGGVWKQLDN
jgi:hypothetical protein